MFNAGDEIVCLKRSFYSELDLGKTYVALERVSEGHVLIEIGLLERIRIRVPVELFVLKSQYVLVGGQISHPHFAGGCAVQALDVVDGEIWYVTALGQFLAIECKPWGVGSSDTETASTSQPIDFKAAVMKIYEKWVPANRKSELTGEGLDGVLADEGVIEELNTLMYAMQENPMVGAIPHKLAVGKLELYLGEIETQASSWESAVEKTNASLREDDWEAVRGDDSDAADHVLSHAAVIPDGDELTYGGGTIRVYVDKRNQTVMLRTSGPTQWSQTSRDDFLTMALWVLAKLI